MSAEEVDRRSVPGWAVRLISDASATKATVDQIAPVVTETRQKVEGLVTRDEYNPRHAELVNKISSLEEKRIDPLWDELQQQKGRTAFQGRIITVLGLVLLIVSIWVALHTGHVNINF